MTKQDKPDSTPPLPFTKPPKYGSRTLAATNAGVPDNFPALLKLQHAIFADFVNGETTKEASRDATERLNQTVIPTIEMNIRQQLAAGFSLAKFLDENPAQEPITMADKLAAHFDSAISGDSKMNVPALKLVLDSVSQQEQMKEATWSAAVLNDPNVQAAIAQKLHQLKQEEKNSAVQQPQ